ncbi:hypothetical protein M569_00752 [Genlisea aurea]|uniref:Uncharacterized protein n=1 Tax=Genlisea aurea TaxID=192259 RepID=S8EDF8_9LAMI|nr:hypothetical protein M569_00752 [Genlisea aurea]
MEGEEAVGGRASAGFGTSFQVSFDSSAESSSAIAFSQHYKPASLSIALRFEDGRHKSYCLNLLSRTHSRFVYIGSGHISVVGQTVRRPSYPIGTPKKAMEAELKALEQYYTWEVVDLPRGAHPIGNHASRKWNVELTKELVAGRKDADILELEGGNGHSENDPSNTQRINLSTDISFSLMESMKEMRLHTQEMSHKEGEDLALQPILYESPVDPGEAYCKSNTLRIKPFSICRILVVFLRCRES